MRDASTDPSRVADTPRLADPAFLELLDHALRVLTHRFQGFPYPTRRSSKPQIRGVLNYLAILVNPAEVLRTYRNFQRKIRSGETTEERCRWYLDDVEILLDLWRRKSPVQTCTCGSLVRVVLAQPSTDVTGKTSLALLGDDPFTCGDGPCTERAASACGITAWLALPLTVDELLALVQNRDVHPDTAERFGDHLVRAYSVHQFDASRDGDDLWRARHFFNLRPPATA